ncbi:beta-eliminating lyase-related protein [Thalassospira sp.]|uniref:threonine aldolase family protein n=1 Tax=Thalassospira sp. TaxID=1912094 RepID=UPI000C44BA03|nr:beta-eliminating lyase-related protein [Thalassospira sp.]MBC06720.1 threonine aldolase [Thalassospira sp.]|tara:strand:+ start:10442 stop:11464 length:1023 start_codon:yes stop_codon:yes gene_type:complete
MNFSSDNVTPICPEILAAIVAESDASALPYGVDDKSQQLDDAFSKLFGTEVCVVPVATGTAANVIGLSGLVSPFGGVVCHHHAHINVTESTGVAFYGGGAKLLCMDGPSAKIEADALDAYLTSHVPNGMHSVDPECVAITQSTEFGTVYSVDEIQAIGSVCQNHQMRLFMDGARFANAVAALDCHPSEITSKAGVDVLSFGATKNGALAVDAIILFDPELRRKTEQNRKRGGHLFSKHRYLAAQLLAYLKDDLWLRNARHANEAATALAKSLSGLDATPAFAPQGNELFIHMDGRLAAKLRDAGIVFRPWPSLGPDAYRFVCAWNSPIEMIKVLPDTIGV